MGRTDSPWGRTRGRPFFAKSSFDDAARPRDPRAGERHMKSVLITGALVAAAAVPSFAKTVRIPVTRGAGGVPIPCAGDPVRTCHTRWHPAIPDVAPANPGATVLL